MKFKKMNITKTKKIYINIKKFKNLKFPNII